MTEQLNKIVVIKCILFAQKLHKHTLAITGSKVEVITMKITAMLSAERKMANCDGEAALCSRLHHRAEANTELKGCGQVAGFQSISKAHERMQLSLRFYPWT